MLSRFFLNNSNTKMLAPHSVHIAVTISSLIASLCFTFAKPFDNVFLFIESSFCIGQRKYKQKFMTQGRSTDRPTDRSTKQVNSRSLTELLFCMLQNSRKNGIALHSIPYFGDDQPQAKKRRKKWVDFVKKKRAKWEPLKNSAICSVHFKPEDFQRLFAVCPGKAHHISPV